MIPILSSITKTFLNCVSKSMARIILKHVYNCFIENHLFYKYQAGFYWKQSMFKDIDKGMLCCMFFCDLICQKPLTKWGIKVYILIYKHKINVAIF